MNRIAFLLVVIVAALASAPNTPNLPSQGKIIGMQNGDTMCYLTVVDAKKKEHNIGADFSICENEKKYLNKKVKFFYQVASVNDCESADPCGKSRKETLVHKVKIMK